MLRLWWQSFESGLRLYKGMSHCDSISGPGDFQLPFVLMVHTRMQCLPISGQVGLFYSLGFPFTRTLSQLNLYCLWLIDERKMRKKIWQATRVESVLQMHSSKAEILLQTTTFWTQELAPGTNRWEWVKLKGFSTVTESIKRNSPQLHFSSDRS